MYFFKTSAFLLVVAACAVADLDFSGSFGRDSGRQLRGSGSGFGGRGIGNGGFDQGFGGQAASARAVSFSASSAASNAGYGFGGQDGGMRFRGGNNYGYNDNNVARGQRTQAVTTRVTQVKNVRANIDDDGFRRYGSNYGFNRNNGLSALRAWKNNGFSGMRAFNGNTGFGVSPVSTVSSVPAVLLAFPSMTSVSYGTFPSANGFYGPYSANGFYGPYSANGFSGSYSGNGFSGSNGYSDNYNNNNNNGFSDDNGFSGYSRFSDNNGFSGYNGYSDNNGYSGYNGYSDNNGYSGFNRFDDDASNYRGQADSAAFAQTRSYNKVYSEADNSNRNAGSAGNVAFLPVVTVPTASGQGSQGAGSRHTKVVKTTITESDDDANQGSVASGGLRAAVVPVMSANYGSGSYGGNSENTGAAASYATSASSASSFAAGNPGSYGVRSSGFNGNAGNSAAVASSRSFSASSSQAGSASLNEMN